jgi:glycosyltransferase involved in cell wall biosynthesis
MRRGCILLSTYNGQRYLRPQIESLLGQKDCDLEIFVRDDGSSDNTVSILREYASGNRRVRVYEGQNLGVVKSFLWLLQHAAADFDGYFFSDQDDVWDCDKVAVGLERLESRVPLVPSIYCARVRYVDAEGRALCLSPIPSFPGFANALVECVAVGCTMALNRAARDLIVGAPPQTAIMHDWWCYLVVSAFGNVLYDEVPRMDYRQHGKNLVGASPSRFEDRAIRLKRRLNRPRGVTKRSDQARELLRLFGDRLEPRNQRLLTDFVFGKDSLQTRVKLVRERALRRGTAMDQAILDLQILLNDY